MPISTKLIGQVAAALAVAFLISLILTPVVRTLAVKMGAVLKIGRASCRERVSTRV